MTNLYTILIVDDQPTNRRILVGSLEKAGHRTLEACDGVRAVELARTHLPDLILMDVCMPVQDGFAACELLKASDDTASIPVIFLTAQSSQGDIDRAFAVGGSDYITKPFRVGEVKARVSVHLQLRVAQRKLEVAHAERLQSQKLESVGQLAAGIAHEINTPMQYIGDNTRFIQGAFRDCLRLLETAESLYAADGTGDSTKAADEFREALDAADLAYLRTETDLAISQSIEGIERVNQIVRAMKEFSHPGSKSMSSTDLNHCIENTVTLSRNEWKHVSDLDLCLDRELPMVDCVSGEVGQVFLNIIVNAAHAIGDASAGSGAMGRISICSKRVGESAEIRISDTGGGIPEEIRDRVFDPFFTTKEVGRGTGQGLAIAHAVVVKRHGGTLRFETEAGKGTTFIIRLPLRQVEAERAGEAANPRVARAATSQGPPPDRVPVI